MNGDYVTRMLSLFVSFVVFAGVFVIVDAALSDLVEPRSEQQKSSPQDLLTDLAIEPRLLGDIHVPREPRAPVQFVSDCMHVTSEPGHVVYKAPSNDPTVCGIYFLTDPDRTVELRFTYLDVPCERGGLVSVVDGWELNGEVFPSANDHPLPLEARASEFCGKRVKKVFTSTQNAALIQYRIPQRGRGFTVYARYPKNPTPCNVLVDSTSDLFTLRNYGRRVNCTLSAMYPAAVRVIALGVGMAQPRGGSNREVETGIVHKCDQRGSQDYVQIGGSEGLDSSNLVLLDSICGVNSKPEAIENVMGCGITSVRLVSSGAFDNSVTVAIRPANENDIMDANLVCAL